MRRLVFLFALPMLLAAQGSGRRAGLPGAIAFPWWDNPVASGLNLTDAQNQQIRAVVKEYRSKLIDLRAAEEKAQGDFQDIFNDTPQDQRRANEAIDRLATARAEATRAISQMSLRMRNILTAEQYQQLQQRMEERRGPGRMPPPGADLKGGPGGERRRRMDPNAPPAPNQPAAPPGAPAPPKPPR